MPSSLFGTNVFRIFQNLNIAQEFIKNRSEGQERSEKSKTESNKETEDDFRHNGEEAILPGHGPSAAVELLRPVQPDGGTPVRRRTEKAIFR